MVADTELSASHLVLEVAHRSVQEQLHIISVSKFSNSIYINEILDPIYIFKGLTFRVCHFQALFNGGQVQFTPEMKIYFKMHKTYKAFKPIFEFGKLIRTALG